jgi:hypothetical protein
MAMVANVFLRLVETGRIQTLADLRHAYRKLILKTHPDAVGSDKFLGQYLELSAHYEEARASLASSDKEARNHRLEFFKGLHRIELLELPYAFQPGQSADQVSALKQAALRDLAAWNGTCASLYENASREYAEIKSAKPSGPYLKHALALNIRPFFFNVTAFHISGQDLYARQARQNIDAILHRLKTEGWTSLHDFMSFLLDDMNNGAAALD